MVKDYSFLAQEKEKWTARKKELETEIEKINEEEKRLKGELAKMHEQISYYDSLTRDMKRDVQPSSVSEMLKSM